MKLYFIRHAQSENNALWSNTGSDRNRNEDPEITELGARQAQTLAEFLVTGNLRGGAYHGQEQDVGFELTHLYASLMVRAVKTGMIVAKKLGLPLMAWEDIHERGGIFLEDFETGEIRRMRGKSRAYFETNYPDFILPTTFIESGWWDQRAVEERGEYQERARRFLRDLLDQHGGSDDRVAVISHGGFYNDLLIALLGLSPDNKTWFTMYNAALTRIDFHEDLVEVVYQNRIDYLPSEMVT